MSNQPQTTTNAPSAEPRLCKMGCGFFGSCATGDCCSKCWLDLQKKQGVAPAVQPSESVSTKAPVAQCVPTSEPTPMEVEGVQEEQAVEKIVTECPSTASKKKKKKASYKSMMAAMLHSSSQSRDLEQEKESLRKVTGGGAFSKIDKI